MCEQNIAYIVDILMIWYEEELASKNVSWIEIEIEMDLFATRQKNVHCYGTITFAEAIIINCYGPTKLQTLTIKNTTQTDKTIKYSQLVNPSLPLKSYKNHIKSYNYHPRFSPRTNTYSLFVSSMNFKLKKNEWVFVITAK